MKVNDLMEDRVDPDDSEIIECRDCGYHQNMMHGETPSEQPCDNCGETSMAYPADLDDEYGQR